LPKVTIIATSVIVYITIGGTVLPRLIVPGLAIWRKSGAIGTTLTLFSKDAPTPVSLFQVT
jgi:hypothetical protein